MNDPLPNFVDTDFIYFFKFSKLKDNFKELWRMKSLARDSLKEWLLPINEDFKAAENIANACSELIENCIKYSLEESYSFILISANEKNKKVVIETSNKSEPGNREAFKELLDYIQSSDKEITDIYLERFQISFDKGVSQLGIIKIIMETNGTFNLVDDKENDIVHTQITIDI